MIEVPQSLKTLSSLEKQLVSKIIPFMKILSLPKGAQHGLKGQVVLVPSNVQQTVSSLPRTLLEKPPLQKFTAAVNLIKDARNIKVTFVLTLIEVKIQS